MANATLTLLNGTVVTIEGTTEEIKNLLDYYGAGGKQINQKTLITGEKSLPRPISEKKTKPDDTDLSEIVNLAKTCSEAERMEEFIMDQSNEANRVLLPLYIVHEYVNKAFGLTTTEISKVTVELGSKVSRQNVNRALKSSAPRYVIKQGSPNRYFINRRGIKHLKSVLSGTNELDGNESSSAVTLTPKTKRSTKKTGQIRKGSQKLITELIESGFFNEEKSINDVQKKLEEMGYLVVQSSLSGPLLNLVRNSKLTRTKTDKIWHYFAS